MKTSTDTTSTPDSQSSIVILFGVDEHDKPRAATFTGPDTGLLTKAAAAMSLRLAEAKTTELLEVAKKLPKGRLYSNGRGFVPYVRRELYAKFLAAYEPNKQTPT